MKKSAFTFQSFQHLVPGKLILLVAGIIISNLVAAQDGASLLDQQIQLSVNKGTVLEFIHLLEKDHSIHFSFNPEIISSAKEITVTPGMVTLRTSG